MWRVVEFGVDVVARTAGAGARGAATLNHEPTDDSVKRQTVVVTDLCQPDHISTMSRSNIRQQIEQNSTVVCVEFDLIIVGVEVYFLQSFKNFRLVVF